MLCLHRYYHASITQHNYEICVYERFFTFNHVQGVETFLRVTRYYFERDPSSLFTA